MKKNIREYFSFFNENPNSIYLDSAATGLKLKSVCDKEYFFNKRVNSSSHSIHHTNGLIAMEGINKTRKMVKEFINADLNNEIIFTSGATFGLNTVIFGICERLEPGDEICTTLLEHSSLIIPLLKSKNKYNLKLNYFELNDKGMIDIEKIHMYINMKTKFVAFASISNTVSANNNICEVVKKIREINKNIIILIDVAQSISYYKTDVKEWDVDFICFSAHKMYGPWGLGIMYGREKLLGIIDPIVIGGGSIYENSMLDYELAKSPEKFEAGTQNMAAIYAYSEVFEFYKKFSIKEICVSIYNLKKYFIEKIKINKLQDSYNFFGLDNDGPIILIDTKEVNPHDFIQYLHKKYNIIARSGNHCALNSKIITHIERPTIRISFGPYNLKSEIDVLIKALINKEDWKEYII
ncbi:aminotransferase class V-fold PLP-dependent enzyme [Spiroplasma endosymbiont of Aspidapion aeneum]|uniref:aminotransferase class V-fold PLP-dependent enzyme n=1 Tax=Spiroplasma endosymbiont of Aspidapion aeneum TaxID=3066276 RepID=UPI00313EAD2A